MTLPNNFILMISLIAISIAVIYFLLPKFNLGRYGKVFIQISIAFCGLGYIAYDKFKQENYTMVVVLIIGAVVFAYSAFNAKERK
jgi:drug/metabolite transporter (DMT)-like permease